MENKNELWDADKELFASMSGKYSTHNEKNFFQNMQYKEEYEPSLANDLILSEHTNHDKIYIVREIYDEYVIGCSDYPEKEVHVMNLSEALTVKLSQIGVVGDNETLGQWLRSHDYEGVMYNGNYDNA